LCQTGAAKLVRAQKAFSKSLIRFRGSILNLLFTCHVTTPTVLYLVVGDNSKKQIFIEIFQIFYLCYSL